ncbi:MAG: cysteine desulfurase [Proteobacteria bacterium]|nr:MAG: cysteine desulfurase [Pseudomonadota bacterium]QKK12096.1 MAG: cysteine desulfurase [Pseudomonadota bacterium]
MNTASEFISAHVASTFDVAQIRRDFPVLNQEVHGKPLVYLDNAATTQKPRAVIEAVDSFYRNDNANIHRGVHLLSERATRNYEDARKKVQRFINAADSKEIIFVRGATEAINLVAQSYGRSNLKTGDEILITEMEHHSNIVPWQMLCEQTGAILKVVPFNDWGELQMEEFHRLLNAKTRLVAVVQVSNSLGTINPVKQIIDAAHAQGTPVLVDGAQSVPHMAVDVQALDCDFFVLSGHKLFAPTGVGVLYGKAALLDAMPPYQGGGDMIRTVSFDKTQFNALPYKFEAGTPHIAGVIGLGAAIDYLDAIGMEAIAAYEHELLDYATAAAQQTPGLTLVGTAEEKASILAFLVDGIHAHDLGTILDHEGVAIRAGHHCTMPVMQHFGVAATARASFAFYNTYDDVDRLVAAIAKAKEMFGR